MYCIYLPQRPIRKCAKSVKTAQIAGIPPHPNPLPPGEGTFSPRQGLCKGLLEGEGTFSPRQGLCKGLLEGEGTFSPRQGLCKGLLEGEGTFSLRQGLCKSLLEGEGTFSLRQGSCKGLRRERGLSRPGKGYAKVSAGRGDKTQALAVAIGDPSFGATLRGIIES